MRPIKALLALATLSLVHLIPNVVADEATRAKFQKLAQKNGGVVKLDSKLYDEITVSDRDWSVVIEYTALGANFKCAPCHLFRESFRTVAKSWQQVAKKDREHHFFATLDFNDGQSIFRTLGFVSAPVVVFKPAANGPHKVQNTKFSEWQYDFSTNGFDPAPLARELSRSTPTTVPYKDPPPYGLIFSSIGLVLLAGVSAKFFWPVFSAFFFSRWLWAVGVVAVTLIFTSGYMFTRIRNMPFAQGPNLIAGGYSNQFGAEVYIVAALYGTLSLTQLALIWLVPRTLKPQRQRIAIYIWVTLSLVLYSILMQLFRQKNGGYPFKLLF